MRRLDAAHRRSRKIRRMTRSTRNAPDPIPDGHPWGGFLDARLAPIAGKLEHAGRLTREDGLALFQSPDLLGVGWLATRVRERFHGNKTYYNINRHIDYTNVCVNHCKFCAFSRDKGAEGAWEYSLQEIFDKAVRDLPPGGAELHIVGGPAPRFTLRVLPPNAARPERTAPHVHLKAFTAVEIAHLAKLNGLEVRAGAWSASSRPAWTRCPAAAPRS